MSVLTPTAPTKDSSETASPTPTPRSVSQRVRVSRRATIALAVAVAGALTVATGVFAAPGAALGLLAALIALGGFAAARQRHVAGTGIAALALLLGLAALAIGALAVTGALPWPDTATNNVTRLQEWLDSHAPWVTPEL
jgi:drug/metabolite transporter (DMT)-like permease